MLSRLFSRLISIIWGNFLPLIILVGIANIPAFATQAAAKFGVAGINADDNDLVLFLLLGAVLALAPIATAFITYGISMAINGKNIDSRKSLNVGLASLVPVLVAGVMVFIFTVLGCMLFLIPGLIIMCRYFVVTPIIIVEKKSVREALKRSAEITDGYKLEIFYTVLILAFVGLIVQVPAHFGVIYAGLATTKQIGPYAVTVLTPTGWVIEQAVGLVFGVVYAVLQVLVYHDLLSSAEHDMEEFLSVFD